MKNRGSIIAALGVVLTLAIDAYFGSYIPKLFEKWRLALAIDETAFFVIIISLALIIIFFHQWLLGLLSTTYYFLTGITSRFVYNLVQIRIEYIRPDGSIVSIKRENYIKKLLARKMNILMEVDGLVVRQKTYSVNSRFSFPSNNKVAFESDFYDQPVFRGLYYTSYSVRTLNSFLGNEEYWIFAVANYCKLYCLAVIIPNQRKIEDVKLYYKRVKKRPSIYTSSEDFDLDIEKTSDWNEVESPQYLVTKRQLVTEITVRIAALKLTDKYKLVWKFK